MDTERQAGGDSLAFKPSTTPLEDAFFTRNPVPRVIPSFTLLQDCVVDDARAGREDVAFRRRVAVLSAEEVLTVVGAGLGVERVMLLRRRKN